MLRPESRSLMLENFRPPPGYQLNRAVGTTFTLDLMSLLTAPLAFTFFDWDGLGARRRRVDMRGRPLAPRSHPIRRSRARRHTASSFRTISSPRDRMGRLTTGC